ncbi:MAG: hypothetical protein AABX83_01200 [Nanoarchaeota archaeon]
MKRYFSLVVILIFMTALFFVSLTLAQYSNEPEIIYYNTLDKRTDNSDIYLIKTTDFKNGTIIKTYQSYIYSNPVNILDNDAYKPFTDIVDLKWNNLSESFVLSWQGKQVKIKPIIVDNQNKEYTINEIKNLYPEIVFNYNIEKTRKYKYRATFSNLPQEFQQNIKSIKFSLVDLQGLTFNELKSSENSIIINDLIEVYFDESSVGDLNYVTADKSLSIENINNKSEIAISMIVSLT